MTLRAATLLALIAAPVLSQQPNRAIEFPDIPGYETMVIDLHTHTALSTGLVWPVMRIREAQLDGLDGIAITDHFETRLKLQNPDRNLAYDLAAPIDTSLLVIRGSGLTDEATTGHFNAVLLEDVNALPTDDAMQSIQEASRQGGFVFWDYPAWIALSGESRPKLTEFHELLMAAGLIHGINVVTDEGLSGKAIGFAREHGLVMVGGSDVREVVDWRYDLAGGGHRPVTIAFVEERSVDGLREALASGRTVVFARNQLMGDREWVIPLMQASLVVSKAKHNEETSTFDVTLTNKSRLGFELVNSTDVGFRDGNETIIIEPFASVTLEVTKADNDDEEGDMLDLGFRVSNIYEPVANPYIRFGLEWK